MPIGYNQKVESNDHICVVCGNQFHRKGIRKFTAKYCSIRCKAIGQKGVSTVGAPKTGKTIKCFCGNDFYAKKNEIDEGRKCCSRECYQKYVLGKNTKGENHWNWKNDKVGYHGIHSWLRKTFGKADKCENNENHKGEFEYALLKGKKYERKRENFKKLCHSCHAKYDNQ